jgi:virulence-associated protein VapD
METFQILTTIFIGCAAQNETNSYQQILQNIRTVLNTFGNVNQTSLIQAAQLISQLNDVIDIQQVVGAISIEILFSKFTKVQHGYKNLFLSIYDTKCSYLIN